MNQSFWNFHSWFAPVSDVYGDEEKAYVFSDDADGDDDVDDLICEVWGMSLAAADVEASCDEEEESGDDMDDVTPPGSPQPDDDAQGWYI